VLKPKFSWIPWLFHEFGAFGNGQKITPWNEITLIKQTKNKQNQLKMLVFFKIFDKIWRR